MLELLLGILTAFAPLSIDMYLPAFPTIFRDLGASPADPRATVAKGVLKGTHGGV